MTLSSDWSLLSFLTYDGTFVYVGCCVIFDIYWHTSRVSQFSFQTFTGHLENVVYCHFVHIMSHFSDYLLCIFWTGSACTVLKGDHRSFITVLKGLIAQPFCILLPWVLDDYLLLYDFPSSKILLLQLMSDIAVPSFLVHGAMCSSA